MRVLLIDDEFPCVFLFSELLTALGHTPVCFRDGDHVDLRGLGCDLAIIDYKLTGSLTGLEVAAQIAQVHPMPVILMSASPHEALPMAKPDHYHFFISKSCTLLELEAAIAAAARRFFHYQFTAYLAAAYQQQVTENHRLSEKYAALLDTVGDLFFRPIVAAMQNIDNHRRSMLSLPGSS